VRTLPTSAEINGDFSALLALPTPIQLHMPGQPGVPIPGNNVASMITTDGKSIGAVYDTMRQVASQHHRQRGKKPPAMEFSSRPILSNGVKIWFESITPSTPNIAFTDGISTTTTT